jgi:hypothetical protein
MIDTPRGNPEFFERIQKEIEEGAESPTSGKRSRPNGHDPRGGKDELVDVKVYDAGDIEVSKIPPRGWLLGLTFCRKFISGLIAEGGAGKTAIRYVQLLAAATGRNLTGEHVHVRCHVLIVSLEDDLDEIRRRIGAAMLLHGVTQADIKGWLHYCTPKGLKLLQTDPHGVRAVGALYPQLIKVITELNIDLITIDPFVKCHGVEENDNNAIDQVCIMLATIADEHDCAVDLVSHARKGGATPGDAERERGASSKKDAGRLMRTATGMTEQEGELFGVPATERKSLVRVDDAKINLAPRSAEAMSFKIIGVPLGNGNPAYPNGDNVQTAERWAPPDIFAGVTAAMWNTIIDEISAGLPDGRRYTNANNATDRAGWKIVAKHIDRTEAQARAIINIWVKNQVLLVKDYDDPVTRKPLKGLTGNPAKRPG